MDQRLVGGDIKDEDALKSKVRVEGVNLEKRVLWSHILEVYISKIWNGWSLTMHRDKLVLSLSQVKEQVLIEVYY